MDDRQTAFQDRIDARFPYDDPMESLAFILEARRIAPEASFAVLHEICIPPRSARAGWGRLKELLASWAQGFEHPLKPSLLHCAEALIDGQSIPAHQTTRMMDEVAATPDVYNALAIVSAAAARDGDDIDKRVQEIQKRWRERA